MVIAPEYWYALAGGGASHAAGAVQPQTGYNEESRDAEGDRGRHLR